MNCGWRNEYGSDPRSYEHFLSSSENKAWKKFRPVRDLYPSPRRYRCSAQQTELTRHGSDPRNYEHYLDSRENKAWKIFRPARAKIVFRDVIMQVLDVTLTTRSFRFRRPQMLTNEHDQKQYNAVNTSIPTSKKNGSEGGKKKHRNSPKESKLRHSDSTPRCSATEPQIIHFVNPSNPKSD